jgi:hypothetical protein
MKFKKSKNNKKGFTLLYAVLITSIVLAASIGFFVFILRELMISNLGKDSQRAFYAADSVVECILFWDFKHPGLTKSAFATDTLPWGGVSSPILCNQTSSDGRLLSDSSGLFIISSFLSDVDISNQGACATTTVFRKYVGNNLVMSIKAYGRNIGGSWNGTTASCDGTNPNRVERGFEVTY